ncbi:hypothetical protein [Streptosporangium sp. G12]
MFLLGGRGVGGVETLERAWTVVRFRRGAEDDVAQHEQRSAISEHLDGGVDRTPGPWFHDSSLTGISSSLQ